MRPDQVVDFLALTGDAVDNVPGVPGIGPVSATALLKHSARSTTCWPTSTEVKGPRSSRSSRTRRHRTACPAARGPERDLPMVLDWDALKTKARTVRP